MKPDKKQIPQLVILGLLVVACIGYLSFKIVAPKASTGTAQPQTADTAGDTQPQEQELAFVEREPVSVFPDLASVPSRRDPFVPQPIAGSEPEDESLAQVVPPPVIRTAHSGLPRISVTPVNPFGGSGKPPAMWAGPPAEEPEPNLQLTGTIRGDRNVAIIRSGGQGHNIVSEGQLVDGRYRVVSVTDNGAVLAHNNRRIYVKLGGK